MIKPTTTIRTISSLSLSLPIRPPPPPPPSSSSSRYHSLLFSTKPQSPYLHLHLPLSSTSSFRPILTLNSLYHHHKFHTTTTTTTTTTSSSSSSSSSSSNSSPHSRSTRRRPSNTRQQSSNLSLLLYTLSLTIFVTGLSYAAVPLYRAFCSATGFGGTPSTDKDRFKSDRLIHPSLWGNKINNNNNKDDGDDDDGDYIPPTPGGLGLGRIGGDKNKLRPITVKFNADKSDSLPWKFQPSQKQLTIWPGETALAFYKATNLSESNDIIGIATYNVTPDKIAPYFSKIECFCFEEQRLIAGEEVDLPLFFFIDRDFLDDPTMIDVDQVVLSYTFFRAKRDLKTGNLVPDPIMGSSSSSSSSSSPGDGNNGKLEIGSTTSTRKENEQLSEGTTTTTTTQKTSNSNSSSNSSWWKFW